MRRFDEPIQVRHGLTEADADAAAEAMQFLWRGKLWTVREVLSRWRETGPWWQSAMARAARGEGELSEWQVLAGEAGDLLAERDVWRVLAGSGLYGRNGVYELAHSQADGSWLLRSVVD